MKKIRFVLTAVLFALFASSAASEDAATKYRNYTPKELLNLSQEELHSEVPMSYTMAARRGLSQGSELLFGMELNSLMYAGLHDFDSAVKAFQSDLGEKPTGRLTVWQIDKLQQRAQMQKLSALIFPDQFSSVISENYAIVRGTMTIIDERIAWPINHVRVTCDRVANTCEMTQLFLDTPKEDDWAQLYHLMERDSEHYDIARWEAESIETHPLGTSEDCRNTSLSLNFKTKEFFSITRNAGGDCNLMFGEKLEQLPKPRIAQIVDGEKIIRAVFSEIQKSAFDVLSTQFRKRVEAFDDKKPEK